MAKCVKVILFLLLTVFFQGTLSNAFADKADNNRVQYHATTSIAIQKVITTPDFPYSPVAELAGNMHSNYQVTMTRIQRVLAGEYFLCLKSILLHCADRESSLSQHKERIYNTTVSYFCQSISEYYVFALRRIII